MVTLHNDNDTSFFSRKNWLKSEGSPKSRIDRCVFKDEKEITSFDFNEFTIKR